MHNQLAKVQFKGYHDFYTQSIDKDSKLNRAYYLPYQVMNMRTTKETPTTIRVEQYLTMLFYGRSCQKFQYSLLAAQ